MALVIETVYSSHEETVGLDHTLDLLSIDENDLIFLIVQSRERGTVTHDRSGWTEAYTNTTTAFRTSIFWKIAGASEPTTITFTTTASTPIGWISSGYRISGADTTTPINASVYWKGAASTAPTIASITPSVDNCLIISGLLGNNDDSTLGLDAQLTPRWSITRTSETASITAIGGSLLQSSATATGIFTYSSSLDADGQALYNVAIAPSTAGDPILIASAATFLITGTDVTLGAPKDSEGANLWFNNEWWKNPFWGTSWWTATSAISIAAESATFLITGTAASLEPQGDDVTLDADAGSFLITGTDASVDVPLVLVAGSFLITGTDAFFQIELTSDEFIISNSTTFDNKNIVFGSDIVYNSETDLGYTAVSRIDVDSILLDGIYGDAPQPYQIHKYVGEITTPSVTIVEFNNGEWRIVSTTTLGL